MSNVACKYRVYLTPKQIQQFNQDSGNCRFLYNLALQFKKAEYQKWLELGKPKKFKWASAYDMSAKLTELKKLPDYDWLNLTNAQVLREAVFNLDKAFENFLRGIAKYPKFHNRFGKRSVHFTNQVLSENHPAIKSGRWLWISDVHTYGTLKIRMHKDFPKNAKLMNSTLSKDGSHDYISFCFEVTEGSLLRQPSNVRYAKCGIDLGVVHPLTVAWKKDGKKQHKFLGKTVSKEIRQLEERRHRLQKIWSRKYEHWKTRNKEHDNKEEVLPFSNNMLRLKADIERCYQRERFLRNEFSQQTSDRLAKHFEVIKFEDLKIKNMTRSAKGTLGSPGKNVAAKSGLNREMLRLGLGKIVSLTEYKAKLYGGTVRKVDPKFTSQRCSSCGYIDKGNRKSQSKFVCRDCENSLNADVNAALNILVKKPKESKLKITRTKRKSNFLRSTLRRAA